ncbi:MAG: DUF5661 family protein [Gemmatimonadota bacterium]
MNTRLSFTTDEALAIGQVLGIDWRKIDPWQFRLGVAFELEHGRREPEPNVTGHDLIAAAKVALAHIKETPDYYSQLDSLESEASMSWKSRLSPSHRGIAGDEEC